MEFTFGIITTGHNDNFINIIINSIENNKIPNYEIIIVGNTNITGNNYKKIFSFDETIKEGLITRKKLFQKTHNMKILFFYTIT